MKSSLKRLPKSQIEIEFELTAEEFKKHVADALLHLQEHIKIDGFRQGQVPQKIVEEKIGKENLLMEAGDLAVKESYSKFIVENKLEPIGEPDVQIIKIAQGSPFLFKVKFFVLPDVRLPDYKKIASLVKKKEVSVDQEEIEDSLNYLRKSRAKFSQIERPAQKKDFVEIEYFSKDLNEDRKTIKDQFILGEGKLVPGFEDNIVGMKKGEEKEFSLKFPPVSNAERSSAGWDNSQRKDLTGKNITFKLKLISVQKVEIPEINDEFAKSLGNFNNLDSLKANIKEEIRIEKEIEGKQRQRAEILEKIAEKLKIEIPEVLINLEKERSFNNFKERINQNFKISFEEYLASIKKDEKSIKDSFLKEAEKKVKNFLILREVGKKENILVSEKEIEEKTNKTIKNYPIEIAKKIDIDELKEYIKGVIFNEKVFEKLESFSKI